MKKILTLLGAIALTLTLSSAADMKCGGDSKKEVKCQAGKCGKSDKKDMKCQAGKCGATDKNDTKKVPKKGKCGQGKCG